MNIRLLALLAVVTAFAPLSMDLYLPGLTDLRSDLDASESAAHLTVTACIIGLAVGQLTAGLAPERYGRRPPLLIGMSIWIVATLLCAAAPNIATVMVFRFIQGIGAGTAIAVTRVVIADLDPGNLAKHVSRMMLILAAVPILAPSFGAIFLSFTDWRGIFVFLALVGVTFMALIWRLLPETHPGATPIGFHGTVKRYRSLLRNPRFLRPVMVSSAAMTVMFAYIGDSAFVFRDTYGLSEMAYGVLFGVNAISLIAGIQLSPLVAERIGARRVLIAAGVVGTAAAVVMAAAASIGSASVPVVVAGLMVVLLAAGCLVPLSTAAAIEADHKARSVASGLMGATQFAVGGLLGAAPTLLPGEGALPLALTASVCLFAALLLALGHRDQRTVSAPEMVTPIDAVAPGAGGHSLTEPEPRSA